MTPAVPSTSGNTSPGVNSNRSSNNGNNTPMTATTTTTQLEHATTAGSTVNVTTNNNNNNHIASNITSARARADSTVPPPAEPMRGPMIKKADRILITGKPDLDQCDNQVISARFTIYSFFPLAILQQFRRFANVYFLVVGMIMILGTYTPFFKSGISPWTTLGPLSVVLSISLLVEANSDYKRHKNDAETNNAKCVILERADNIDDIDESKKAERDEQVMNGKDVVVNLRKTHKAGTSNAAVGMDIDDTKDIVSIAFQKVARKEIRQGHFVLVKNREMVPADIVLLASSNDSGCAYIETSSIDGETNLKLRTSPQLPKAVVKSQLVSSVNLKTSMDAISEVGEPGSNGTATVDDDNLPKFETIDAATKRLTRLSGLGWPDGLPALLHPSVYGKNAPTVAAFEVEKEKENKHRVIKRLQNQNAQQSAWSVVATDDANDVGGTKYAMSLVSEPPNPSVHTFSGKLTFPPAEQGEASVEIPLGAENVLLRGAVVRNTEWVIGLAVFTGKDTKLVQNSYATPSKFSQLDVLMNKTVIAVLLVLILIISYLATTSIIVNSYEFDSLFYAGFNRDETELWPYLPNTFEPPKWRTTQQSWLQLFLMYVTLMNNFIPLSLYVTVEMVTWGMLYFVYSDIEMYDDTTNTRAVARNTNISDLGRIQYIFSDKTGTLTQNVMRFKRCSVDGIVFGAPTRKLRSQTDKATADGTPSLNRDGEGDNDDVHLSPFLPLRQLLVGKVVIPSSDPRPSHGLEGLGGISPSSMSDGGTPMERGIEVSDDKRLTFNAEMFLRVMSLCHTVVVEKDIDKKEQIDSGISTTSSTSNTMSLTGMATRFFGKGSRKRSDTGGSSSMPLTSPLSAVAEDAPPADDNYPASGTGLQLNSSNRVRIGSTSSLPPGMTQAQYDMFTKNDDGAPVGYAYQAESPDEGALVSAASSTYGFQVIARDTNGIRLRCSVPSHFQDSTITQQLKQKEISLAKLAADTRSSHSQSNDGENVPRKKPSVPPTMHGSYSSLYDVSEFREETWSILAINKFDSDRKRMSILLRAPAELGSMAVLFCKGADSAMLDPDISDNCHLLNNGQQPSSRRLNKKKMKKKEERDASAMTTLTESDDEDEDFDCTNEEWEMSQMLETQVHLGEFAKEGLRTLVLGMRIIPERECFEWLELFKAAATSMKNRNEMLTEVAKKIETGLHIVGATAIEDKLQVRVPETIATLEKAGIKLWVLTGDKRETAVEIGYSTHVLTPKMHLTEVPDQGKHRVRTQMAMEFIRLVKIGRLPLYQKAALDDTATGGQRLKQRVQLFMDRVLFKLGKAERALNRLRMRIEIQFFKMFKKEEKVQSLEYYVKSSLEKEAMRMLDIERRRMTRARAERTVQKWLQSEEGLAYREAGKLRAKENMSPPPDDYDALVSEETPVVFTRASSAKSILTDMQNTGDLTVGDLRKLSLAHLTASQIASRIETGENPLVDEDTLSLDSFMPSTAKDMKGDFDKKKRTLLERCFAIDKEVRKGRLRKHLSKTTKERLKSIQEGSYVKPESAAAIDLAIKPDAVRALVIEGAALKHLLGEPDFEEILFAVASNCNAVIACRVSPKQKAELVNLVRCKVRPEPITLAIGDGANDVGMIQEAHVGIGISGKEGKQAVNASDFSISQFRFLETLILIHGRWDFFRLSIVVMFSFYKNTVMAGLIIIYSGQTVYSGTPLFDEWVIAMLNFVAAWPIIMTGLFDRCLSKEYVRNHPEVYKATRENELITFRVLLRWICLVFIHMCIIYYFSVPQQAYGGGQTPAFHGLMRNEDRDWPGNGEGGDLKSAGTVTFTCMVLLFAYKVLFETRSLVHGKWPALYSKDGEGFFSRVGYTWVGVTWMSILFYFFSITMYSIVGRKGASQFSSYVEVAFQVMTTRSLNWILILFVPVMGISFDITGKLFSNMFYPTQTQIHMEIESKGKMDRRLNHGQGTGMRRRRQRNQSPNRTETA